MYLSPLIWSSTKQLGVVPKMWTDPLLLVNNKKLNNLIIQSSITLKRILAI